MVEKRKAPRGRPREVERPVRICIRVSETVFDALDRVARDEGSSIPSLLREGAFLALKNRQGAKAFVV